MRYGFGCDEGVRDIAYSRSGRLFGLREVAERDVLAGMSFKSGSASYLTAHWIGLSPIAGPLAGGAGQVIADILVERIAICISHQALGIILLIVKGDAVFCKAGLCV